MIRNRLLYLVALVSVTAFYAFFYGWFSEFLWYLVLVLPVFSLLISLPAMLTLRVQVEVPGLVRRGSGCNLLVRTRCGFPPCGVKLRLEMVHSITGQSRLLKFTPRQRTRDAWELPVEHCGCVRWSLSRVWVCDYLGLISLPRRLSSRGQVLVLPRARAPLRRPSLRQYFSRPSRPKPGGGFSERHELRDYRPGDSLRTIHWKLTAKTDRLMVREPQEPPEGSVVLSLDLPEDPALLDSVLDRALYLSQWLLRQGLSHQVVWFSGSTLCRQTVAEPEDCAGLSRMLCRSLPGEPGHSARFAIRGAQWYYHVESPEPGEEGADHDAV